MKIKVISVLFSLMTITPTLIFAHGTGHEVKNDTSLELGNTTPMNKSIYAIDSTKDREPTIVFNNPLSSELSNDNILSGENFLTDSGIGSGDPMIRFEEKMNSKSDHSQHEQKKQLVEKATHEWVSPNAKGHRVAIGITVISGLIFVGLSFFRIGEKNSKDPL